MEKKYLSTLTEKNVRYLDMGLFSIDGITDLSNLFEDCNKLEQLHFEGFDTSKITSFEGMFDGCNSLKSIEDCSSLKVLDISGIKVTGDTHIEGIFDGCSSIREIIIRNSDKHTIFEVMKECFRHYRHIERITTND